MEPFSVIAPALVPAIADRWSPRAYLPTPIPPDVLARILTAAGRAPSSRNEQPWRLMVGQRGEPTPTWQHIFDCLDPSNQAWNRHTPVLLLLVAKTTFTRNNAPNASAAYDCGAAAALLALQATAEGLQARQMAGIDPAKARELFSVPEGYEVLTAIALGYPGPKELLPTELQAAEGPRPRKPLDAWVFGSAWAEPLELP